MTVIDPETDAKIRQEEAEETTNSPVLAARIADFRRRWRKQMKRKRVKGFMAGYWRPVSARRKLRFKAICRYLMSTPTDTPLQDLLDLS